MNSWVKETFRRMSLEQKLGQLMVSYMDNEGDIYDLACKGALGGLYSVGSKTVRGAAEWIRDLQKEAQIPLLMCSDFEYGNTFEGGTSLPSSLAIGATGDPELAREAGRMTAREVKAIGFRLMGSPVCDINCNPRNPIVNIRSYGETPEKVSEMAVAYLEGVQGEGVHACLKHFPGHGDTDEDSHRVLPRVRHEMDRMESVELAPFAAGIAAGGKCVMTTHIIFSALDPEHPATMSLPVLKLLLREKMGFRGVILSDAMAMHAIAQNYEFDQAVGLAIQAGCDAIIPSESMRTFESLKKAHRDGVISESRIDESAMRILAAKAELDLVGTLPDPDEAEPVAADPEHKALARRIASDSIALLADSEHLLPLTSARAGKTGVIIISNCEGEDVDRDELRIFEAALRCRLSVGEAYHATPTAIPEVDPDQFDTLLVGLFIQLKAYNVESGRIPDAPKAFLEGLLKKKKNVFLLSFGSPYPLAEISGLRGGLCAFSDSRVSIEAAVGVLTGEIPPKGEVPSSLKRWSTPTSHPLPLDLKAVNMEEDRKAEEHCI